MLGEHCDECGNPLFRLRGQKVCAVCDRGDAVQMKRDVERSAGVADEADEEETGEVSVSGGDVRSDLRVVAERLSGQARQEDDLGRLHDTLDALRKTLDMLERV